jgi:hypothetical protein
VAELLAWLYQVESGGGPGAGPPPREVSAPQAPPAGRPPAAAPPVRSTGPGR